MFSSGRSRVHVMFFEGRAPVKHYLTSIILLRYIYLFSIKGDTENLKNIMASSTSSHMSPDPSSTSSNRSSSTTDLKFRRATFQDYDAVVELSKDLFEGVYDYMKTMFFQFLHSKDHHVYVLEYNKQLVIIN